MIQIYSRRLTVWLAVSLLCILLAGCDAPVTSAGPNDTTQNNSGNNTCFGTCTVSTGAQGVKLFVEPDAGDKVITDAIKGARKTVWVEMYLLTERNVISALQEAAQQGLQVRVMLEVHPYGGGDASANETLDKLKAAGVQTKATSPSFALTHEKGMIIDSSTAYIMTANFTLSALGGSKASTNREYGIIDTNAQDVQNIIAIFNADWNRTSVQISAPNLVVSPTNSRSSFVSLIGNARKTIQVEAEEMFDQGIEQALLKAAQRGVRVQVILPRPSNGSQDANKSGINLLKQGGTQVREDPKLYMHAKIIIVDGQRAFVGSENISSSSLDRNRELGIIVADAQVLITLQQTFQSDWSDSLAA